MTFARLLLACVLALAAGAAGAQVRSFLLIPGVPGESVDEGHRAWIDLNTVSVGVAERACTGVTLSKNLDRSSPLLSGAALTGGLYATMTIDVARSVAERPEVFLVYTLTNVSVASIQATTTATAPTVETVHLAPSTITMVYTPPAAGGPGTAVSFTLNCVKK